MQVQPIAALRPVKIRPKQTVETAFVRERETKTRPQFIPPQAETPPVAAPFQNTDGHGLLTAQLIITHQALVQSELDRTAQISSYTAADRREPVAPTLSLSV